MASCELKEYDINEIQIENGKVQDCKGCSYKMCLHYGKQIVAFMVDLWLKIYYLL